MIVARRLVAQRCLYGVDRNPMAVDLAKVSLWLATLAKERALTFVDHALRHGDSLVGLSRRQIEAFHWDTTSKYSQQGFETIPVREQVAKVAALRRRIREADASVTDWEQRDWWNEARFQIGKVRLFGDLAITAAFFEAKQAEGSRNPTRRVRRAWSIDGRADAVPRQSSTSGRQRGSAAGSVPLGTRVPGGVQAGAFSEERAGEPPTGEVPGFRLPSSAIRHFSPESELGGRGKHQGSAIRTGLKPGPRGEPRSNADLVAHFFRRAFDLVHGKRRAFGLIATNTDRPGRHVRQRPALDLHA